MRVTPICASCILDDLEGALGRLEVEPALAGEVVAAALGELARLWPARPIPATAITAVHRRLKAAAIAAELRAGRIPADRPRWIWGAGQAGRRFLRALEAEEVTVEAAVDIDPRKIGRRVRDGRVPVVAPEVLPSGPPRPFVLVAVAAPGARERVRAALRARGYVDGADFRAVT